MTPHRLVVFARLPVLGRVKTRLAASVGPARALAVHRRLLAGTLRTARAADVDVREFRFESGGAGGAATAHAARHAGMPGLVALLAARGWAVAHQQGADLGARMADALHAALARGERVVLVGCDCPVLVATDIAAAFDALTRCDAVFMPAEDGGYALVGLSRPLPQLFGDMPWGTSGVMAETHARAAASGARAATLRTVWDVDTVADLDRWDREAGRASD